MFIKIFKTILILCICLGISIPTNAAVSVSDNSAFITRAEALAVAQSLSERIIVLENTVDEKIDNLITAYLERNGVWNAQEQVLQNRSATVHTTNRTANTSGSEKMFDLMCVANTTRSGVFSAEIYYYGANYGGDGSLNLCRIGYTGELSSSGNKFSDNGFDLTLSIYEDNTETHASHTKDNYDMYSELRYTMLLGSAFGQRKFTSTTTQYIACFNLPSKAAYQMIRPMTFFVQKNSSIWWSLRSNYRFAGVSSATAVKPNGGSGADIAISINNALIN